MSGEEGCRRRALRGWRYSFRDNTSLMAEFSSARSAYIRFSFAFSASNSLSFFSSETEAPAYRDPPVEVGGFAHAVLACDLCYRQPGFSLPQHRNDLGFRESRLLRVRSPRAGRVNYQLCPGRGSLRSVSSPRSELPRKLTVGMAQKT